MFEIDGRLFAPSDAELAAALPRAYEAQHRPLCRCRAPGVEMYIARLHAGYIIKRMPNSGHRHAPTCASYEPPPSMSGLGELLGTAIQTDVVNDVTALRLDFAMSKAGRRDPADRPAGLAATARRTPTRMSLRALLHYLLDQSRLTWWAPAMADKRPWRIVRKYLLLAAERKEAKGCSLARQLFIPESYSIPQKVSIAQRRQQHFASVVAPGEATQRLMLLIGEVKEFGEARFGKKMVVKHMPDAPFLLKNELFGQLQRRLADQLSLWDVVDDARLLAAATFSVSPEGASTIEEMTLMVTTDSWHVFENMNEKLLLDALISQQRRFVKTLRYDLPRGAPIASAILLDCGEPLPLYIASPDTAASVTPIESALTWVWNPGLGMPPLPSLQER